MLINILAALGALWLLLSCAACLCVAWLWRRSVAEDRHRAAWDRQFAQERADWAEKQRRR